MEVSLQSCKLLGRFVKWWELLVTCHEPVDDTAMGISSELIPGDTHHYFNDPKTYFSFREHLEELKLFK